jgi:potassium/hydrogen antiporter
MLEPLATAWVLATMGGLLAVSVALSRLAGRTGFPIPLLFLGVGVVAGSEGLGGIVFEDYQLAFRLGTAALTLILFDGGLNTTWRVVRLAAAPATLLATIGVAVTAAITTGGSWLLGLSWPDALLVGVVVSSTDAAAVFAVLRGSGQQPKRRVAATLELESGLNDPMAVALTLLVTQTVLGVREPGWASLAGIVGQMAIGAAAGVAVGYGGRSLLRIVRLSTRGLYPVLTIALALVAFGFPSLVGGSGFLGVYLAAIVLGNGTMPDRVGVVRVHDSIAWFCQVSMFVLLGMLVFPSRLPDVALTGIGVALLLSFVARPLAVGLCLAPFGYTIREVVYVGWVGLRGAVPIVLVTIPLLAGVEHGETLFSLVFFVVVLNTILPGMTIGPVTRALGLQDDVPPAPVALLEIASTRPLRGEILSFRVEAASAVANAQLAEIPFPPDSAAMLVIRGEELIAPRGATVLHPDDHVYVFCRPEDRAFVHLLFGRSEE